MGPVGRPSDDQPSDGFHGLSLNAHPACRLVGASCGYPFLVTSIRGYRLRSATL